jgi:hypothetical protein
MLSSVKYQQDIFNKIVNYILNILRGYPEIYSYSTAFVCYLMQNQFVLRGWEVIISSFLTIIKYSFLRSASVFDILERNIPNTIQ